MAMKEQYYTIDGQMLGYKYGGIQKDFLSDSLGSVTAEIDQTQAKTYDGRYKSYGGTLSSTGAAGSYQWIGSFGYRAASVSILAYYCRARHYGTNCQWNTRERQHYPNESPYVYANDRPTVLVDPSGNQAAVPMPVNPGLTVWTNPNPPPNIGPITNIDCSADDPSNPYIQGPTPLPRPKPSGDWVPTYEDCRRASSYYHDHERGCDRQFVKPCETKLGNRTFYDCQCLANSIGNGFYNCLLQRLIVAKCDQYEPGSWPDYRKKDHFRKFCTEMRRLDDAIDVYLKHCGDIPFWLKDWIKGHRWMCRQMGL